MKIADFTLETFDIRLSQSISTGAGSLGDRSGVRLTLTTDDGPTGRGETAPIPGSVSPPSLDDLASDIRRWAQGSLGRELNDLLDSVDPEVGSPVARFAVHTALADIASRAAEVPLHAWLRAGSPGTVHTNSLITSGAPAAVHEEVAREVASGVRAIKLKVGGGDIGFDATRIIAASEAAGPAVELRLDANRSWSRDETERIIGRVGQHRLAYVEDPTGDPSEYGEIERDTGVAMAIDVQVDDAADLGSVLERSGASVLVVKAAAVGGVDRILDAARMVGTKGRIVVSSSLDGPLGLTAGLHAAAALPGPETAHGLATAGLVTGMPAWLHPEGGTIELAAGPGLSIDEI